MYNFYMIYVEIIKQIMQDKGLSQQAFADILGVNQTTVGQWLLGKKKPGYDSIMLLYEKFDIEPNQLFGLEWNFYNKKSTLNFSVLKFL